MTVTKKTAKAKKPTKKTLTTKQQRFVDLYDGNATEAARQAGYKGNDKTLAEVGAENLRKPGIKKAIKAREEKRNKPLIADREERQQFWTDGMRDKNADRRDRQKDSELLGRSEADFTDKQRYVDKDGEDLKWRVEVVEAKAKDG